MFLAILYYLYGFLLPCSNIITWSWVQHFFISGYFIKHLCTILNWLQETACRLVKSIGDDKVLLRVKSEGLAFARKSKATKKAVKDLNCDTNKENDPCYIQCSVGKLKTTIWLTIVQYLTYITPYDNCH